MNVDETKYFFEFIVAIFGVIGGLVATLIFIIKWRKKYILRVNKFFSGSWSNEGNIGGERLTHFIDLTLECHSNKVNGSFNIRKRGDDHTWHAVGISGKLFMGILKCKITHIRHGEILDYGSVTIKRNSKGNLRWYLKKGTADFFPEKTVFFRQMV